MSGRRATPFPWRGRPVARPGGARDRDRLSRVSETRDSPRGARGHRTSSRPSLARVQRVSGPRLRARSRVPPRRTPAGERAPRRGRSRAPRRGDRRGSDRRGTGRSGSSAVLARARPRHASRGNTARVAALDCTPVSARRSSISTRRTSTPTSQSSHITSRGVAGRQPRARDRICAAGRSARGSPARL